MTRLERWLKQATRQLSKESVAQVRREIGDHYESALEMALQGGASGDEADRLAVVALGDARRVNCEYRKILLTAVEARTLREGAWEARAICARPWLKRLLWAVPVVLLLAAVFFVWEGSTQPAGKLLVGGVGMGVIFVAPFMPVYTPARARAFRFAKWAVLLGTFLLAMGPDVFRSSWLLLACLWPVAWVEWTRFSVRRKLRVADWPKHLYL